MTDNQYILTDSNQNIYIYIKKKKQYKYIIKR